MITEFLDSLGQIEHDAFQLWRRQHAESHFFAFQTKNTAKIHINGGCHHPGDAEWTTRDEGASLTRKRKVCAEALTELTAWADDNGVVWT